ncbi:thiamine phosphate synthase [Nocardioides sp. CPCC 205120]|uniref:thiamine phosphate synthase n=1 Tax=Nocardioides sp. CPCC 205120 TaxID=3406462 RepID=UPI003B503C56
MTTDGVRTDVVLLTDRSQLSLGRGLVRTVRECAAAGLRTVVVRELDLAVDARRALVARLREVPDLTVLTAHALLPGAHGVHLAAHQPDHRAGDRAPGAGIHARSCHDVEEVARAAAQGAAYVTLSPFAATASKPGHGPSLPPAAYGEARRRCAGSATRVLALGGIDARTAADAVHAGAHGVAVMGAVMRAPEPAAEVAALLAAVGAATAAASRGEDR